MALTSFVSLPSVVTALFTTYRGTLDRLRIHHAGAWLRIPFQPDAQPFADGPVDELPGAVHTPFSEVVVDGWPSREVVRKQAPLAAALQEVEDGVQDLTKIVGPWTSVSFGSWQLRLYVVPFGVGEICRVRLSHAC